MCMDGEDQARNNNHLKENAFRMSYIVVFTKFRFYGLIGSSDSVDSIIFGQFLHKLLKSIHEDYCLDQNSLDFVMDNVSPCINQDI